MDVDDDKSFAHTHTHRNMFDEGDVYGEIFFIFDHQIDSCLE